MLPASKRRQTICFDLLLYVNLYLIGEKVVFFIYILVYIYLSHWWCVKVCNVHCSVLGFTSDLLKFQIVITKTVLLLVQYNAINNQLSYWWLSSCQERIMYHWSPDWSLRGKKTFVELKVFRNRRGRAEQTLKLNGRVRLTEISQDQGVPPQAQGPVLEPLGTVELSTHRYILVSPRKSVFLGRDVFN